MKSFLLPGGVLLLALAVFHAGVLSQPAIKFYCAAALGGGLVLAWRFHSTRVFFALAYLLLSHYGPGLLLPAGAGSGAAARAGFDVIAVLLPLNFLALSLLEERGFVAVPVGWRCLFVFVQTVAVVLLCRQDHLSAAHWFRAPLFHAAWFSWTRLPQISVLVFLVGLAWFGLRSWLYRKPVESGFFWSLGALFLGWQLGNAVQPASGYVATAALILLIAVVETSYQMAYHDELTGLPGRRAFNQAVLGLQEHYAVAIVDVDHFKQFNDKYGHDTGDSVLRMVASRLARVTGGGKAFRCGGEEFAILFPDKSVKDVLEDLELLRETIEQSKFRVRSQNDRRRKSRGSERRKSATSKVTRMIAGPGGNPGRNVSVTVSIGVAEPNTRDREVEQVIRSADKALYGAKEGGRNRVETGGIARARSRTVRKATAGAEGD